LGDTCNGIQNSWPELDNTGTANMLTSMVKGTAAQQWSHPGGKLKECGAEKLTDEELLAVLISTGIKGKSAEEIAKEILRRFSSFKGMANQPFEKFLRIKGIGDVKITRIAAAFEIARRIVNQVLEEKEK